MLPRKNDLISLLYKIHQEVREFLNLHYYYAYNYDTKDFYLWT